MNCRFCQNELKHTFIDLFNSPASNSYISKEALNEVEIYYPLKIFVCDKCFLVQIDEYKSHSEIFNEDYAYFSSFSSSWLKHAKDYVEMITDRLNLTKASFVIEIASNDGYLLQYFKEKSIPCLGIEPTHSTAKVAKEKGIEVVEDFFTTSLSKSLKKADLILGNNVLAHVPDINDFVNGLKETILPNGVITLEFPHLLNLINLNQFDTIYHEHFSYLSLFSTIKIFEKAGLKIFDVEELSTHGGSLRIYATHIESDLKIEDSINRVLKKESDSNLHKIDGYKNFKSKVDKVKFDFLTFLLKLKSENRKIVAYGAAAKGNTLLNYCGVKSDIIDYVVDRSPYKQNKFLPASHIPIVSEELLKETKPDYIVILPWNIKSEIKSQLSYTKEWGAKFITAIPHLEID